MKSFTFVLVCLIVISIQSYSQDNWSIVEPDWKDYVSYVYNLNSFDDGQLVLLTDGNIYHFFQDDLANVSLINFTDWDTSLRGVSGKNSDEIVMYGWNYNSFSFPISDYSRVFYKLFRDTNVLGNLEYKFQINGFQANGSFDANIIYSNVSTEGNGISVAKFGMWTFSYNNWTETDHSLDDEYEAQCGVFHNQINYLVAVNKKNEVDIFSTLDGSVWNLESSPRSFKYNDKEKIVKLIVNNEKDFYVVTKKAIYYSLDSGENWNIIDLKFYEINDAVLRNSNEIYFCGNNGLIAKLDLQTFEYHIFENSIKFELLSLHFMNNGECWIGGKSEKLLKYTFGTSVGDETSYFEDNQLVYPNPVTDFITIHFSNKELQPFAAEDNLQIFDVLGIEVGQSSLIDNTSYNNSQAGMLDLLKIDVSHLPAGVYFIRFGNKIEKFVKM